jgi:polyhydroxybutyrate depolymerase
MTRLLPSSPLPIVLVALSASIACSSSSSTSNGARDAALDDAQGTSSSGGTKSGSGGAGPAGGAGTASGGKADTGGGSGNATGGAGGKASGGAGGKASGGAGGNASGGAGGGANTGGSTSSGGSKSAGCGKTGAKTGDFTLNVTVGSASRSFEVVVSTPYDPSTPVPLAFVFHGLGGDSAGAKSFGLQDAASKAGNAGIFVFPQGVQQGTNGVGWDISCGGTDTPFFDAMAKQLEDEYCVATDRLFVTGFSWGGDFANTLACCRGNVVRAAAPASGALYISTAGCTAQTPAFRLTSGTADPNYSQAEFMKGLTHAQTANHCTATQAPIAPAPCQAYQGCDPGKPVIWCSYSAMGHQLPDGWGDATWAFFSGLQ